MKKIAFPWIDGHDQSSDLSEHPIDDAYSFGDTSTRWYDTFRLTPGGGDIGAADSVTTYSEGVISPVDHLESLLVSLDKQPDSTNILVVESNDLSQELKSLGHNVVSFSKSEDYINESYIRKVSGDIRFYNFNKKFDIIFFDSKKVNSKIAQDNILSHLADPAFLVDLSGKIFEKKSKSPHSIAQVILKNGNVLSFRCNIAKDSSAKTIGLQSYSSLPNDSGLLFKYEAPTDVTFHMGTVGFPIDIIFANKNGEILKISKEISPGDLSLYSCSGVSSVLEISGGLSSDLGINVGDVLREGSAVGINKSLLSMSSSRCFLSKSTDGKIEKFASYREYFSEKNTEEKNVSVFCFDQSILSNKSFLKVYSSREVNKDDIKIYRDVNNCTFATDKAPIKVSLSSLASSNILKSHNKRLSIGPNQSMSGLKISRDYLKKAQIELRKNNKVVVATSSDLDNEILEFILHSKIASEFPGVSYSNKISVMKIPKDFSDYEIICAAKSKYISNKVKLFENNIVKTAGVPVPEQTKKKATNARRFFVRAEIGIQEILNDLNFNKIEYEKFSSDTAAVKNSKGEYNRSCKKISKKVKTTLVQIRDGIRIMNSIKDVSSTIEMIDRLTVGAKEYSSHINNIFELINIIETPDFVAEHTSNVTKTVALGGDLSSSLLRAKNYIDSNILGITILSE